MSLTAPDEQAEAVIISGPLRGQIVTLADPDRLPTPDESVLLDALEAAFNDMAASARAATEEARALVSDLREARKRA